MSNNRWQGFVLCLAYFFATAAASQTVDRDSPILVILTRSAGTRVLCELLDEAETSLEVRRLVTGKQYVVKKADLARIEKGVTEAQAIRLIGLPQFATWRTARAVAPASNPTVAILPFLDSDGNETEFNQRLASELTELLTARGIGLVDSQPMLQLLASRPSTNTLDDVLVGDVGRKLSAAAVLVGTVLEGRSQRVTRLRLISADGNETLFRINHQIETGRARVSRRSSLQVLEFAEQASSVAFSPDGEVVATSGLDGAVRVWDSLTGQQRCSWAAEHKRVQDVTFSPDGKQIAASYFDGTVAVWAVDSGDTVMTVTAHPTIARTVAFSGDGQTIASAGDDSAIKLWNVRDNRELGVLLGHTNFVRCVTFSGDGKWLASASNDRTIRLWDLGSREVESTLQGHRGYVYCVAFSPNGKLLASASSDGTAKLWNLARRTVLATIQPAAGGTHCVRFSPDGRLLATCHANETVKIWSTSTQEHIVTLVESNGAVRWLAFSPDGERLAAACSDNTVRVWDVRSLGRISRPRN